MSTTDTTDTHTVEDAALLDQIRAAHVAVNEAHELASSRTRELAELLAVVAERPGLSYADAAEVMGVHRSRPPQLVSRLQAGNL